MSKFGLLGEHLGHSMSPQLHAMIADYSYELFEVAPDDLADFLHTTDLDGMNVTIPYKKAVIPYCAELSERAERLGSVNTLVRRANGWYGENTDYAGFCCMLRRTGFSPKGKKGLVLGSGGASKTVQAALRDLGAAEVVEISRSGENNYVNLSKHMDAQFIVNATPVGMYLHPEAKPVDAADFPHCEAVYDLVYNPLKTELLRSAEARDMITSNGLCMLAAQAVDSAALFLGHPLPEKMKDITLCKLFTLMRNIVLIGMPGCGKSTVGRLLAKKDGRAFFDSDEEITRKTGRTPEEIITADGEAAFRDIEAAVIAELSLRTGSVIACGGGAVLREENRIALRRNGVIVWLQRDLKLLETAGRPLSQREGLAGLYTERTPIYESFADYTAENVGSVDETADRILEILK